MAYFGGNPVVTYNPCGPVHRQPVFYEDLYNTFILVKNSLFMNMFLCSTTMKSLTVLEGKRSATAVLEMIKGLAVS